MNLLGEPASVGRHCGGSSYEITRQLADFYADALDDHHPLYARFAPPLLLHSEAYKFLLQWYLKHVFGNLHARQDWELFAPIPIGSRVRTRSTIVDRYQKRGRDYVVNETDLVDAETLKLLVRSRSHQSFLPPAARPKQGFVVDEDSARHEAQPDRAPFPTATGAELAPVTKTIDPRRCWMFSGPARNYHNDREEAKKLGFPNIVVQGMMTTCFVAQGMLDRFGEGFLAGGRMALKLTNVVWVDETLTARAKERERAPEGGATRVHCDVWVDKADGTRVLLGDASALE